MEYSENRCYRSIIKKYLIVEGNMDNKILVTRSSMPTLDEYIEEIRPIWDSHWLTNMGVKHRQLQAQLEEFLAVKSQPQSQDPYI